MSTCKSDVGEGGGSIVADISLNTREFTLITNRFLGLRKIHATMVKFDAANKRIASSERSSSRSNRSASKRSNASSKSKKSSKQGSNTSLTEPLLDRDEEMGEASDDSEW